MVQLYEYGRSERNQYWKLDSGIALSTDSLRKHLSNNNFTALKQTTKPCLRELYIRSQRGLLSYEGLPLRELRRFTAQRALPDSTKTALNSTKALKGLLEKADDDATFGHFTELPPELRQIILLHYFHSLVVREVCYKQQPPITLVSRNLRKESLPLFYECCKFTIDAVADLETVPCKLVPDIRRPPFIQNTTIENFAHIKSLRLRFRNLRAHIQIDLHNNNNPVVSANIYGFRWPVWFDETIQAGNRRFLSELRKLTMSVVAREGPLKLRVSDIDEMCEMARQIIESTVP